jgi:hypothetical protein
MSTSFAAVSQILQETNLNQPQQKIARVTVVTSSHARSCMSDRPADLSLPTVAVPEAPLCKRIDLAQNHF